MSVLREVFQSPIRNQRDCLPCGSSGIIESSCSVCQRRASPKGYASCNLEVLGVRQTHTRGNSIIPAVYFTCCDLLCPIGYAMCLHPALRDLQEYLVFCHGAVQ